MTDEQIKAELEAREKQDARSSGLRRVSFLHEIGKKPSSREWQMRDKL